MINFLYKILLTFNSTSLLIVIYWIKEQNLIDWLSISTKLTNVPDFVSYGIYFLIPVLSTLLSLWFANYLDDDNIEENKVIEVEQANNAFLPSYLGYFFVALSVTHYDTLIYIFLILFVFTYFSQTLYFNPLFLLFKYKFYYITTVNGVKIFIITKRSLKNPTKTYFPKLKRINDFTFIDKEL